ncbi:bifunctional hydroxymethylpyrimidine kinase/phosphomethylpyrimidine kinase [Ligilactobacillus equi]|uniref:Thiamine-phosphate synthase n=1 Tax=Ligilactobacillus equi DSM 15833 = JCM 10991 TaxID=1423740 RepID=A0A0R1TUR0_9LACO|nr:bifunctional hydroxymethylpyrimidine kinase/phosphomethylpyrimidine kinase [Ligilactobacillus equi]KRL84558.1 phosphomethylpyrimidine kinase [Ligilactobacillus equi DSM 15833 = JCM 10991]
MSNLDKDLLLYAVTDRKNLGQTEFLTSIKQALAGGVTCLQLREKNLSREAFSAEAYAVKQLCQEAQVPFIINDSLEVALDCQADGLHVGQEDLQKSDFYQQIPSDMILGVSVQNVAQAKEAQAKGANYLGVGTIFPTQTKTDAVRVSRQTLAEICQAVNIPVVAIGGIDEDNMESLAGTGIAGLAIVNAILGAPEIEKQSHKLKALAVKTVFTSRSANLPPVLSIAGSDSSGGAGIQADIKAIMANGGFAMTAITAMTAQNTQGVTAIIESSPEFLQAQIATVFTDIYPLAIKVGMVPSPELMQVIAQELSLYQANNVVLDPVMVATSGAQLMKSETLDALKALARQATLITPNIDEAQILAEMEIRNATDMEVAAQKLTQELGCAVLVKGGHLVNDANDVFAQGNQVLWLNGQKINNSNTHGTGCTLSSAIAANLAHGEDLIPAIQKAKKYLSGILASQLDLGLGSGPMNHGYLLK